MVEITCEQLLDAADRILKHQIAETCNLLSDIILSAKPKSSAKARDLVDAMQEQIDLLRDACNIYDAERDAYDDERRAKLEEEVNKNESV